MKTIPTAEEFINCEEYWRVIPNYDTIHAMIEFTKLHVTQSLEQASKEAKMQSFLVDEDSYIEIIDRTSILNAYPLVNIK